MPGALRDVRFQMPIRLPLIWVRKELSPGCRLNQAHHLVIDERIACLRPHQVTARAVLGLQDLLLQLGHALLDLGCAWLIQVDQPGTGVPGALLNQRRMPHPLGCGNSLTYSGGLATPMTLPTISRRFTTTTSSPAIRTIS